MRIHFIAIGGSAMHNLAIALHRKGNQVTGSDDAIYEPSRSRLDKEGLLPQSLGWDASRIDASINTSVNLTGIPTERLWKQAFFFKT